MTIPMTIATAVPSATIGIVFARASLRFVTPAADREGDAHVAVDQLPQIDQVLFPHRLVQAELHLEGVS